MASPDLVLVFDLLDVGYKSWFVPAFGLIFVTIGFLLFRFPAAFAFLSPRRGPQFKKAFGWVFFGFSVLWTVTTFAATYGSYLSVKSHYTRGEFETVEGPVEDFHPMPFSGRSQESFTVAGQRFSYSDYGVSSGFNNTRSHGGPIGDGVYVRIRYVGQVIVRLEVEPSAVEAAHLNDRS